MNDDDLGARVERIERRLALYDLIASYGPAVDSGSADWASSLWSEHGTYDFGDAALSGSSEIRAMVSGKGHQDLIAQGAAHMLGTPSIYIDGDKAVVKGYSQVCRYVEGHFEVWRVSANRWELTWTAGRWKVDRRQAYLLDGQERGRALLGQPDPDASAA